MRYELNISPKYSLPDDPGFYEKMESSWDRVDEENTRMVCCPVCGRPLMEVYSRHHEVIRVKCSNCKLNVPIDIGIFRTAGKSRKPTFEEFMARYGDDLQEVSTDENDSSFRHEFMLREH